jgi:hypothetical protein
MSALSRKIRMEFYPGDLLILGLNKRLLITRIIGSSVIIRWEDGRKSRYPILKLRQDIREGYITWYATQAKT